MLCLVARYQDQVIRFPLPDREAKIGSSPKSDLILRFPGVSRTHALVSPASGGCLLTDLESKNGIVARSRRVREVLLEPGHTIRLGKAHLTLEEHSTADVEVSLWLETAARVGEEGSSQPEPDTDPDSDPASSAGAALRLVREMERAGEHDLGRRRDYWLARCASTLGAESLLLFEADETGSLSVAGLSGARPDEALLDFLGAAALRSRGRHVSPRKESFGERVVLVGFPTSSRSDGRIAAVFPGDTLVPDWKTEFFDFLAGKLLPPERGASPADEPPSVQKGLVFPPGMIVGESPAVLKLLAQIRATVMSRLDVLLLGETGTGKELYARMIHASGLNPLGPFVAINCAAIPSELLESELFGVQGRVATGVDPREGLFSKAEGGSIFLDEIGELADSLQAKLLRFLQEREILAVGASVPRKINVRVISASNRNLADQAERGRFRPDLYYRLRGLQFHLPPLRERKEDIPKLVLEFAQRAAAENRKKVRGVTRGALSLLTRHSWPGNIRELAIETERAVLLCPHGASLDSEHFGGIRWSVERHDAAASAPAVPGEKEPPPPESAAPLPSTLQGRVDELERRTIEEALRTARGNKSAAARVLGITRNGLAMKMARLGIGRKEGE